MAKNETLFATKDMAIGSASFTSADTTVIKDILVAPSAAGDEGLRIMGIAISSDDSAARDIKLYINDGTTDHPIHHVDIPITAGTDGSTATVDGLNTINAPWIIVDSAGNKYFDLKKGYKLRGKMIATMTAAKTITVTVIAGEYKQ
jgi:hypothetical protein